MTYDANGNLTSDGSASYTWNARNQLVSMTGGSFSYGGLGRRLQKIVGGSTTDFLYDGINPVQELSGGTPTANILTGLSVDEYFTRGTETLLADALGSTVALADGGGTVQTEYAYEPFGATTATGTVSASSFRYTGREDDETGLYYYRARYYHPALHRFVSEDPIAFAGGINFYTYVGNSPLSHIDPLGLATFSACIKGNIGFGVGGGGGTCVNFGYDRKYGFTTSLSGTAGGGGFAGVGGAVGLTFGISNAPTVFELTGTSISAGASGGAALVLGASGFLGSPGGKIKGGEVFIGTGLKTGITTPFAKEVFVNTTSTIVGFGTQRGFVGPIQ